MQIVVILNSIHSGVENVQIKIVRYTYNRIFVFVAKNRAITK